jgi:hypothetical protein
MVLLLVTLGGWFYWASQRPGGVSGTINGWIDNVRGDVAKVSADPDVDKATTYFDAQYSSSGAYPRLSDEQLATAGIGVGVTVYWCTTNAMVIQGAAGGGTVSHLLLSGHDVGTVTGKQGCPANLNAPEPWHLHS